MFLRELGSEPELGMTDHHPATAALPHREGTEVRKFLHMIVDQVAQPAGQRREHQHTGDTEQQHVRKFVFPTA